MTSIVKSWNPVGVNEIISMIWILGNPVAFSKIVLDFMKLC